jgi:uncharacterized membrane protein
MENNELKKNKENTGTILIYIIAFVFLALIILKNQKLISALYVDAAYAALFGVLIFAYYMIKNNAKWRTRYMDFFFTAGSISIILALAFKDIPGFIPLKTVNNSMKLILSRTSMSFLFLAIIGFVVSGVLMAKIFLSKKEEEQKK